MKVRQLSYRQFLVICQGAQQRDTPIYRDVFVRLSIAGVILPEGEMPELTMVSSPQQVTPLEMVEDRLQQMELRLAELERREKLWGKPVKRKEGKTDVEQV